MANYKVVTVFGLSGVGKSWMISRYAAAASVAHVQASQLMRDAKAAQVGNAVTSEDLRHGPVLDNQSLLTDAFAKVLAAEMRPIIFDGHCLVDVGDQPIEIPVQVIRQLQTAGIILVHAPTYEIVRRRESDTTRADRCALPMRWPHSKTDAVPFAPTTPASLRLNLFGCAPEMSRLSPRRSPRCLTADELRQP